MNDSPAPDTGPTDFVSGAGLFVMVFGGMSVRGLIRYKPERPRLLLYDLRIEQEIQDPDIQDPFFIIPAFAYIMANDDLREGIAGQVERPVFGTAFSSVSSA